jgi:pyruvate/2-oxoglutarate dehydrogenase complex dihydrolipoamide dehydrogenase (E3) component
VLDERPDAVIVATGARPRMPAIPGIADSPAVDPFEVLRRSAGGVRRALVVGGGVLGVGVAHVLAERGVEVTLTEPGDELAAEIGLRPRWRFVADLRARANVSVFTRTTVERLHPDGALLRRSDEDLRLRGVDLVVPTRPMVPAGEVAEALVARCPDLAVYQIGDCLAPRTAFEATQEAAALGHRL